MLSLFILAPFILLFFINICFKFLKENTVFGLIFAWLVLQIALPVLNVYAPWTVLPNMFGHFFAFDLAADQMSLVLLLTIAIVALVSLAVAKSTLEPGNRRTFANLLLISLLGMNATVLVHDLFSLYVFIEVTAVSSFVLIALEKNRAAIEGTFKYLFLSIVASVFMLTGIALFILSAGGTSFDVLHQAFAIPSQKYVLDLAVGLFLCGVFIKSGVIPFHGWVPDAYSSAPSAVSVLLAGIVTKVSGVYALIRLLSSVFVVTPSFQNVLLWIGGISIVLAALAALTQNELKRLLSYSSISQIGYIMLALGCGTYLAFAGAVFHFFNHAIFKSLLFVNAASLKKSLGSTQLQKIAGHGMHAPVTGVTSLLAMLSTAGVPPLAGFWSKLIIILALFSCGRPFFGSLALLCSILTLAYLLIWQSRVFFQKAETSLAPVEPVPAGLVFAEVFLAVLTVGAGLLFPLILNTWIFPFNRILF